MEKQGEEVVIAEVLSVVTDKCVWLPWSRAYFASVERTANVALIHTIVKTVFPAQYRKKMQRIYFSSGVVQIFKM